MRNFQVEEEHETVILIQLVPYVTHEGKQEGFDTVICIEDTNWSSREDNVRSSPSLSVRDTQCPAMLSNGGYDSAYGAVIAAKLTFKEVLEQS